MVYKPKSEPPFSYTVVCHPKVAALTPQIVAQLAPDLVEDYKQMKLEETKTIPAQFPLGHCFKSEVVVDRVVKTCPCPGSKELKVQVIRKGEPRTNRFHHLAYPKPNYINELMEEPIYNAFEERRKKLVKATLRRSLHSLYQHLAKKPTAEPVKKRPKSKENEEERQEHIEELAKPKQLPEPEQLENKTKPLTAMTRYKTLSLPRRCLALEDNPTWSLTEDLKSYEPTDRLIALSKPRLDNNQTNWDPFKVKQASLKYRPTARIEMLAAPKHPYQKPPSGNIPDDDAPTYKIPKRLNELAAPKDHADNTLKANPYGVSRKALKYKITPRILNLAQPRDYENF